MSTPYETQMVTLRERLRVAFDPQSANEERIVEWLGRWDIPTLEPLADMAERTAEGGRKAVATAYERGYHQGAPYAREHGGAGGRADAVCRPCRDNRCAGCENPRGGRLAADGQLRGTYSCGRRFV